MSDKNLETALFIVQELWEERTDPSPEANAAQLDEAFSNLKEYVKIHHPDLYIRLLMPDGELPDEDEPVVSLADVRVRQEHEAEAADEAMAYLEAMWTKSTFQFDVAVRDLEGMRRGTEDPAKPLRPPETYHEAIHMIMHIRALANDVARHFGIENLIEPEDDIKGRGVDASADGG